ncbi:MAG: helix-turn-helix domain-containing protein [Erythrobacter sp.]
MTKASKSLAGNLASKATTGPATNDTAHQPLRSETGTAEDGTPLAFNRCPDDRIRPWVGRSMVAFAYSKSAKDQQQAMVYGQLCNDCAYLRTAVGVDWTAGTAQGPMEFRDETFLCGQHSTVMPLRYAGGIKVAGLMLRPGALHALFGLHDGEMLDRITLIKDVGIPDREVTGLFNLESDPSDWLEAIEGWLADYVAKNGIAPPDPLSQALELQAFADPNCVLSEFAEEQGVSPRTVERAAKRDFGLTPKQIMRRARILDLAAQLCGVADEEEEEIILRFFDQAHQIREFHAFFNMTPGDFVAHRADGSGRSALVTLSLEIRQARRLELLDRIRPGAVRPWMRRAFLDAAE